MYKNFIGKEGVGINGWQVVYYPEYAGALLWNQSRQQVISYTPPKGVESLVNYARSKKMKGVFSWTVDDDNGMLLEAAHRAYGHSDTKLTPRTPRMVYAPECRGFTGAIKPGMLFVDNGTIYKASGWITKCPGQGAAWENAQWQDMSGQLVSAGGVSGGNFPQDDRDGGGTDYPADSGQPEEVTPSQDILPPSGPVPQGDLSPAVPSVPEDSGSQGGGSVWSRGQIYSTPGEVVTHQGKQYKNINGGLRGKSRAVLPSGRRLSLEAVMVSQRPGHPVKRTASQVRWSFIMASSIGINGM